MSATRSYVAFISYRHRTLDKEAAERVQKKIENYKVPKEFQKQLGRQKLGLCFRDEDELPASSSLTDSIYDALDNSQFLIVICTPDLPKSEWCEAEIRYFLKKHDRDHVLAVLADGTPDVSFSPYMLHSFDEEGNIRGNIEPLAANIAGENHTINRKVFNKEVTRLCAAMIGCPFDALWQRERRAQTNRLLIAAGAALAVMAVFLGVVLNRNAQIAEQNRQILAANDQIQKQNDQITSQNAELEEKNTAIQKQLSTALVDSGLAKLENFDVKGALSDAVGAVENDDPAIYDHRVMSLFSNALLAYKANRLQTTTAYQMPSAIRDLVVSADQSRIYLIDNTGVVRCLSAADYEMLWETSSGSAYSKVYPDAQGGLVVVKNYNEAFAVSAESGERVWTHPISDTNTFACLSPDGRIFAVKESDRVDHKDHFYLLFLNAKDGSEIGRTSLADAALTSFSFSSYSFFSPDCSQFYCYNELDSNDGNSEQLYLFSRIDLATFERTDLDTPDLGHTVYFIGSIFDGSQEGPATAVYQFNRSGVVIRTYPENGDSTELVHDQSIKGFHLSMDQLPETADVLTSDAFNVLVFANDLIITDKEFKRLIYMPTSSLIVKAFWGDDSKTVVYMVTDDGNITELRLDKEAFKGSREATLYGVTGIGRYLHVDTLGDDPITNPASGRLLFVCSAHPDTLFATRRASDPDMAVPAFQELLDPESIFYNTSYLSLLPDNETAMLFTTAELKGSEDPKDAVIAFDRRTGDILNTLIIKDGLMSLSYDKVLPLDAGHFLYEGQVCDFEGNAVPLALDRLSSRFTDYYSLKSVRLTNGKLMTFYPRKKSYYLLTFPVWLDEEMVSTSNNVLTGLNYDSDPEYLLSKNGWILCYGNDIEQVQRMDVVSEEKRFSFFNAEDGALYKMANAHPKAGIACFAGGNVSPVFATASSDGYVTLYYPEEDRTIDLKAKYDLDDIKAVLLSSDDKYVLVLTSGVRLDIYDLTTMEQVFSEVPERLYDAFKSSTSWNYLRPTCEMFGATLLFSIGSSDRTGVLIDTESWSIESEVQGLLAADLANKTIYTFGQDWFMDYSYYQYPLRSLGDMTALANKILEDDQPD